MSDFLKLIRKWFPKFILDGTPPAPYGHRSCQGAAWRLAFPFAPKQDLREFLELFVDAFAFSSSSRLNFAPDDSVLGIYRALYPSRWTPDALEVETFAKLLERRYRIRIREAWRDDLTLGDIFALAHPLERSSQL